MKNVYLHVGKHKTGSSSIQHYVAENIEFFESMGFKVLENDDFSCLIEDKKIPVSKKKERQEKKPNKSVNCFKLAHIVIRPELATPMRLRGNIAEFSSEEQLEMAQLANIILTGINSDKLIISAEAFSFLRTTDEKKVFNIMFQGMKVNPILYLRDKHSWIKSWCKQTSKLVEIFGIPEARESSIFNFNSDSWLIRDKALEEFFDYPDCTFSYETSIEQDGSVIPAFLTALGVDASKFPGGEGVWKNKTG